MLYAGSRSGNGSASGPPTRSRCSRSRLEWPLIYILITTCSPYNEAAAIDKNCGYKTQSSCSRYLSKRIAPGQPACLLFSRPHRVRPLVYTTPIGLFPYNEAAGISQTGLAAHFLQTQSGKARGVRYPSRLFSNSNGRGIVFGVRSCRTFSRPHGLEWSLCFAHANVLQL